MVMMMMVMMLMALLLAETKRVVVQPICGRVMDGGLERRWMVAAGAASPGLERTERKARGVESRE